MKILITTSDVGDTAPGIVFERLIRGLSEIHDIDVLTANYNPSDVLNRVNKIFKYSFKEKYPRFSKLLISYLGIKPIDTINAKKAAKLCDTNYDIIFSLISFNHYISFIAGTIVAEKYNIKHLAYSVDAIPAPIGWSSKSLNHGTKRFISKYFSKTDGFFSSNSQMLDYQLSFFKKKESFISGIIYTPSIGKPFVTPDLNNSTYIFLYTGGIYGLRKINYLIDAFRRIITKYPDCTLEFVGTVFPKKEFSNLTQFERAKISIHPFTNDLSEYYTKATALIDIDADKADDIYLSSKISNYLTINRIIISETGINSPARLLFKNIPSIIQCNHNVDEIYNALEIAIKNCKSMDYHDRIEVMKLFNMDNIINNINTYFYDAIKN